MLRPHCQQPSRVRRINDLLDAKVVRCPDRVHVPPVFLVQLPVPCFARLEALVLFNLFELVRVANLDAASEREGAPLATVWKALAAERKKI
jgi:hypothetical protein